MKTYKILKGCHYSNFIPSIFKNRKENTDISGRFVFDESCRYEIDEPSCVNKLFGLSLGLFSIHKNSVRFGWVYNKEDDKIYIYQYYYLGGKLKKRIIYDTEIGKEVLYGIKIQHEFGKYKATYYINGKEIYNIELGEQNFKYYLTLGPYFGGNSRAPHKIIIKEID